jgi:serralysin
VPRRRIRPALAAFAGLALAVTAAGAAGASPCPDPQAGPPYSFTTELVGPGKPIPLKNMALLSRTKHGYRYQAGQQNSHLTITQGHGRVRFVDTGTAKWKRAVPAACRRLRVSKGIAASCRVPSGTTVGQPLLIEVWPRLGNDYVDGRTLPATDSLSVLADAGNDVAHLGAGRDFFNGYSGHDLVFGGAGNDWIRSGPDNDLVHAGAGNDYVVGQDGPDTLYGDSGSDKLYGSNGNDQLVGGSGQDRLSCGPGADKTLMERQDSSNSCETVSYQ